MQVQDSVILITGGAKGLGKEIAQLFIARSAKVIVMDLVAPEALSETFRSALFQYIQVNLADQQVLERSFQSILTQTGNRLDVLINNAWPRLFKSFEDFSSVEISNFLDAGLKASLLLTNWALPLMKNNGFGRIIQISSQSAFKGYSSGTLYCSTKMALITFHESLIRDLKQDANIRVLTICPDSFSSLQGKSPANGSKIVQAICSRIGHFFEKGTSAVVFIGSTKSRIWLIARIFEKIKYFLKK